MVTRQLGGMVDGRVICDLPGSWLLREREGKAVKDWIGCDQVECDLSDDFRWGGNIYSSVSPTHRVMQVMGDHVVLRTWIKRKNVSVRR